MLACFQWMPLSNLRIPDYRVTRLESLQERAGSAGAEVLKVLIAGWWGRQGLVSSASTPRALRRSLRDEEILSVEEMGAILSWTPCMRRMWPTASLPLIPRTCRRAFWRTSRSPEAYSPAWPRLRHGSAIVKHWQQLTSHADKPMPAHIVVPKWLALDRSLQKLRPARPDWRRVLCACA